MHQTFFTNRRKTQSGFTLLELLIVISIIAILIAVSSVSYTVAQKKTRDSKRRGDMKNVQNAFEQYNAANGSVYSTNCDTMATGGGLAAGKPDDPLSPTVHYTYSCSSTSTYCVCATLEGSGTGNATSTSCAYGTGSGANYFCVSQLQ